MGINEKKHQGNLMLFIHDLPMIRLHFLQFLLLRVRAIKYKIDAGGDRNEVIEMVIGSR